MGSSQTHNKDKLQFSLLVDRIEDFPQPANPLTHFELAYQESTHYDSIIDTESGLLSLCHTLL